MSNFRYFALITFLVGLILPAIAVSIPKAVNITDLPPVRLPDTPPRVPLAFLDDPETPNVFPPPVPFQPTITSVNGTSIEKRQVFTPQVWTTAYQQPLDFMTYIQINGQGYTAGGGVFVGIYRASDQALIFSLTRTAGSYPGFVGGSFGAQTGVVDCNKSWPTLPQTVNSYAAAYDWSTQRWGPVAWVHTGC
jgi:hypothetical protein